MTPHDLHPTTWAVAGGRDEQPGEPLNVPIVPASNFIYGAERAYARECGTPTWEALEAIVGGLEHGHATTFASGMAAVSAVFDLLPVGARVVLPVSCYLGVEALAQRGVTLGRLTVDHLDAEDVAGWTHAMTDADLVWLESPTNPLLVVADLPAICAAPRKPGTLVVVDNTFATPLRQQPLRLGADIVVHSATKYIGGHSDLLAGVTVAADPDVHARLRSARHATGGTPGMLEAFLTARGARTLGVRLAASESTAGTLAERLEAHGAVTCVRYPGLVSHPTHEIAKRTLGGYGAMISFDVTGGADRAEALCRALRLIRHATSLGAVESSIERRGAVVGQEHLPPSLLRLSVGCEYVEDLWNDLERGLASTS